MCNPGSPCYGLVPESIFSSSVYYLLFKATLINTDNITLCDYETIFTVALLNVPIPLPTELSIVIISACFWCIPLGIYLWFTLPKEKFETTPRIKFPDSDAKSTKTLKTANMNDSESDKDPTQQNQKPADENKVAMQEILEESGSEVENEILEESDVETDLKIGGQIISTSLTSLNKILSKEKE
jgi:hypothetical protein